MSDVTTMSDAELDSVIFDSGESTDDSVSPTMEDSNEQPKEVTEEIDDGQTEVTEEDSEDDSTPEDQTDDSQPEASEEEDEASNDDTEGEGEDKGTDEEEQSEPKTKFQPVRANGKEYPIDDIGELYKLASAGVGAQHKYQAIAKYKKDIMAAQKADVDILEAVNFMANYKDNPRDTVLNLLKENGIDPLDIDTDAIPSLQNKDHSVTDFEVSYDEVVGEIGDSPLFPKVQDVLLNSWDKKSRDVFLDDPKMILRLHEEMTPLKGEEKSLFEMVSPIAEKMKLSGDTRSDYDIYMEARAKKVEEIEKFNKTKESVESQKPKAKPDIKSKKKRAAPTKGKSTGAPALDFSSMSDAELDAFLDKA